MTVALDHVILPTNDQAASAAFLTRLLALPDGVRVGHFIAISLGNDVTVDVMEADDHGSTHLAFSVDDGTFDRAVAIPSVRATGPLGRQLEELRAIAPAAPSNG
jgi:catechol 2,3-dioxygenase-like lactoylglutathione lyase family enzyme